MATPFNTADAILPKNMIALNSKRGQEMLEEPEENNPRNLRMIKRFKSQVNRTYCGPASLALLVNGINVAYRIKLSKLKCGLLEARKIEKDFSKGKDILIDENDIVHIKGLDSFLKKVEIKKNGVTIGELSQIAATAGFGVTEYYPDLALVSRVAVKEEELGRKQGGSLDTTFRDVSQFREICKRVCGNGLPQGLICNYDMATLGYDDFGGHHSPIAAYHSDTDRVLVLDVWPDTQPAWVDVELLFTAMCTVDSTSGLPRGLLFVYELL